MIAENLLSHTIIPLRTSDSGEEALGIMNDFYVRHLPIVNDKQLLGMIAEDEILEYDIEQASVNQKIQENKFDEVVQKLTENNFLVEKYKDKMD